MIKDIDLGWKKIINDSKKLAKLKIEVGLFGEGSTPESNVALRGIINEFGSHVAHIPSRPFTRQAYDNNYEEIVKTVEKSYTGVVEGKISVDTAVKIIGITHRKHIRDSILKGSWIPNAPLTVIKKGSSKPLIDTGDMLNQVTYEVAK